MKTQIEVIAAKRITENYFMGRSIWTHARTGDVGTVLEVQPHGALTVRWNRTGTVIDVSDGDVVTA